ncbi:toll/interleukin-1 receptor domain-containing protein [Halomonas sp. BM-2019]|uniref:toll/interleukin-1 receptor domain-containing protein n=1 Tax=Halomonas sp. BM-2019 TaxID=2811227 RepID=UPI001B3C4915|nr:MAG: toll/interleukin-1 receptor domain-containing protein [Halomonas sp. BM-2019]
MAQVFISYAHEDRYAVARIAQELGKAGHIIQFDYAFLRPGDSLTTKIRDEIDRADFVCVILSSSSVASSWVRQEAAEVLCRELKMRRSQLLLCVIEACEPPPILNRLKRFERVYLDFSKDFETALNSLKDRIHQGERPVFEREQYLRLDIPAAGLDLYLTGDPWNWNRHDDLRYFEMVDGYLLFGFRLEPRTYFKHFALCNEADASQVQGALQNAGMLVSGIGDQDPSTRKRRVWFTLPDYPVEGPRPFETNRWPSN